MTTKTEMDEAIQDVAEVKILKAQIMVCRKRVGAFSNTKQEREQIKATMQVLMDDFTIRKNRITNFIKIANPDQKNSVFEAMRN